MTRSSTQENDHVKSLKDIFESFPQYRNFELLLFLNKNDDDFLNEYDFLLN